VTAERNSQTLKLNQEQQKCRWPGSPLYQHRHSRFYWSVRGYSRYHPLSPKVPPTELESTGDHNEAVVLLRNQHVRMRGMVGSDAVIESLPEPTPTQEDNDPKAREKPQQVWPAVDKQGFAPYTDDPEAGRDPVSLLQEQQRLLDGACCARLVFMTYPSN